MGETRSSGVWTQKVHQELTCWWVRLCICPSSCLAWAIPGLVSADCWEGPGLITNKLEREPKTALASISVLVIGWAPPKQLPQCLHPQVESYCLLPLWGSLQSHNGSDVVPLLITASALVPRVCEMFCVSFESGVFIFLKLTTLPKVNSTGLQRQKFWRFIFPPQDPQVGGGARCWDWIPHSLEETSTVVNYSPIRGSPTWRYVTQLYYVPTPYYPSCCGSLLYLYL